MGSPEDSEDRAHLGPSGRGLRSRGRRRRGSGRAAEEERRGGNKQPGLVIQGKVEKLLQF